MFRLRQVLSPYRLQVSLLLLVVLGATLASLAIPAILQRIIDIGLAQDRMLFLGLSALVILLVGSARSGLPYLQRYLGEWVPTHVGFDMRNQLFDRIQHLSFSFHDHSQTGQLTHRQGCDHALLEATGARPMWDSSPFRERRSGVSR